MLKEKKDEAVKMVEDRLSRSQVAIITEYRGMTVAQMTELRKQLAHSNTEFRVVKNNLAAIAADRLDRSNLKTYLVGPTAIAFGFGDVSQPARMLFDYIRTARVPLVIKGAMVGKRLLNADEVSGLSLLPAREVLLAQLVGQVQAPISSLVSVLSANLSGLTRVLQARRDQLQGGS